MENDGNVISSLSSWTYQKGPSTQHHNHHHQETSTTSTSVARISVFAATIHSHHSPATPLLGRSAHHDAMAHNSVPGRVTSSKVPTVLGSWVENFTSNWGITSQTRWDVFWFGKWGWVKTPESIFSNERDEHPELQAGWMWTTGYST